MSIPHVVWSAPKWMRRPENDERCQYPLPCAHCQKASLSFMRTALMCCSDYMGTGTLRSHARPAVAPRFGTSLTGQLNFGGPFRMGGRTHQLLLEAGAGGERFAGHTDFTVPLGGGFRFMLGDMVALRLDGIVQYVENPTAATFGFPPTPGVNS